MPCLDHLSDRHPKVLTKALIIHHTFIEHPDTVIVTGDLNF